MGVCRGLYAASGHISMTSDYRRYVLLITGFSFWALEHLCALFMIYLCPPWGPSPPPVPAYPGLICLSKGVWVSCPVYPRGHLSLQLQGCCGDLGSGWGIGGSTEPRQAACRWLDVLSHHIIIPGRKAPFKDA